MQFNLLNYDLFDITPTISPHLAVFPGDRPFTREETYSLKEGHNFSLSSINSTLHLGAHADAPSHYHREGSTIEKQNLSTYLGPCQVLSITGNKERRIYPQHLDLDKIKMPRVLIKTKSYKDPNNWDKYFYGLSPELVKELGKRKVKLVGIDTPSVDTSDDKILRAHSEIYNQKINILEGLLLNNIPDGQYLLVALPLPIREAEASPVRAVLLKDKK